MDEPQLIPLSALQHYAFCPRQCALIHLEQAWAENQWTAQGKVLHQRVDSGRGETRPGRRLERGVSVVSERLGLSGKLDLLEIDVATGEILPVEYKRGKPKTEPWDRLQLCAQALCLEEMRGLHIERAALWYWEVRRREWVAIDDALRAQTLEAITAVRQLFEARTTPAARWHARCRSCSLRELCQPKLGARDRSESYVSRIYDL